VCRGTAVKTDDIHSVRVVRHAVSCV